jgi:hypothetical protein
MRTKVYVLWQSRLYFSAAKALASSSLRELVKKKMERRGGESRHTLSLCVTYRAKWRKKKEEFVNFQSFSSSNKNKDAAAAAQEKSA